MVDQQTAVLMGKLAWHQANHRGAGEKECERVANSAYLAAIRVEIPATVYAAWDEFEAEIDAKRTPETPARESTIGHSGQPSG